MDTKPIQLLGLDDLDDSSLQNQSDSETFSFHDTVVTSSDAINANVTTSGVITSGDLTSHAFHNVITSTSAFHGLKANKPLIANDLPINESTSKGIGSMKLDMPFISADMMPLFDDSQDSMDGFTLPGLDSSGVLQDLNGNQEMASKNCSQPETEQGPTTDVGHNNDTTGNVGTLDYIDIEELQSFIKASSLPDADLLDTVQSDFGNDLENKNNETSFVNNAYQNDQTKEHSELSEKASLQPEKNENNNSNVINTITTEKNDAHEIRLDFAELIEKNVATSVVKKDPMEGEAKKITLNGSRRKISGDLKPKPAELKPKIVGTAGGSDSVVVQTAMIGSSLMYNCPHCERTFMEYGHIKQHLNNAHEIHNQKKVGIHDRLSTFLWV